jgi:hypothetical protein
MRLRGPARMVVLPRSPGFAPLWVLAGFAALALPAPN